MTLPSLPCPGGRHDVHGPACFTVMPHRAVWDDAALRCKLRHPHVARTPR